jgi:hypothetical protein
VNTDALDTPEGNRADMARHGTETEPPHDSGEASPRAKLTRATVADIRGQQKRRGIVASLAKQYGVSAAHISRPRAGICWK